MTVALGTGPPIPVQASPVAHNLYGTTQGWGFTAGNITSPGPDLTVSPGEMVSLTLYSADDVRHNFYVDYNGNGLPDTGEPVSADFRSSSVPITYDFNATSTPGIYTYYCDYHAGNQFGRFNVGAPLPGPRVKTTLTLTGEVVAHSRPIVVLVAQINDENGSPVPGVLVHFYRESTWGFAQIGVDASDGAGRANITYSPPLDGHITFMAHFLGSGIYMPSSSEAFIHYLVPQENDYTFPFVWGQNPIFDFSIVGVPALAGLLWVGVVVLIVGSVWTTYLYVVRQLLGIRNSGRGEENSEGIRRLSSISLGGYREHQAQPLRPFDYPRAVITGVGMIALGYADFLALTILVPSSSLLALPLLAFIEALLLAKLFPSGE